MSRRPDHIAWFSQMWPLSSARRARVLGEYQALAKLPLLLADIALRANIAGHAHVPGDPCSTAWNDGRASLAKEIIELAGVNARELLALIDRRPTE